MAREIHNLIKEKFKITNNPKIIKKSEVSNEKKSAMEVSIYHVLI